MTQPKTRALWLIRHAKTANPAPSRYDFNRELAPRGRSDVEAFVAHCENHQVAAVSWRWFCPEAALSSLPLP
jgi:phosphohistidine phosphatase SixA